MREPEKSPSGRSAGACPSSFPTSGAPTLSRAPFVRALGALLVRTGAPALAADPLPRPAVPASRWCPPGAVSAAAPGVGGGGVCAGGRPGGVSLPQSLAAGGRAEGGASAQTLLL